MSKFLFVQNFGADYQEFMTLHGLYKLLGPDRIIPYPFKNTFVGGHDYYPERYIANDKGSWHYLGPKGSWGELWTSKDLYHVWEHPPEGVPLAGDGPCGMYTNLVGLNKWKFDDILDACRSGEIPFIFLSSPRWYNSITVSELRERLKEKCPPIVMMDSEDYYQIRWDFINAFQTPVYFKRTFYDNYTDIQHPDEPTKPEFFPCCFSSLWDVKFVPWEERELDLFCVFGATQVLRERVMEIVKEVGSQYPGARILAEIGHPFSHDEYMYKISQSKIVVDHQRLGTDTIRTWETLSSGPCMVGDLHIRMPHPLIPGEHFIQYDNDMSPEGDKQKLDTLRDALHFAMKNLNGETKNIAQRGYDHVRKYHMTTGRAQYILECIRDSGLPIGDLL